MQQPRKKIKKKLLKTHAIKNSRMVQGVRETVKSDIQHQQLLSNNNDIMAESDKKLREKKFPCEICGKAFTLKHTLSHHLKTHKGIFF